jgi:steroid delta-isomerase-like uncharacterized protein
MQKIIQFSLVLLLWFSVNIADVYADTVTDMPNINLTNNTEIEFNARNFVDSYLQIWNERALDKVRNYYTEDIVYKDMALETNSQGIKELKEFMQEQFNSIPDMKFTTLDVVVESPEKIAVVWLMTGTEDGEPFESKGVSIMELNQGKVSKNTDYYH